MEELQRPVTIHLLEPTGYGGVFQHACELGTLLARSGFKVTFHTSRQHEEIAELPGVSICTCCWWPRTQTRSVRHNLPRRLAIIALLSLHTLPHLLVSLRRKSVLHVQGIAASGGLNWIAMSAARVLGHRVAYSPHDTFSRRQGLTGWIDNALLRAAYRPANSTIVYSEADRGKVKQHSSRVFLSPLIQLVPVPSPSQIARWRSEWRAGDMDAVILIAGFIRPERRVDLLIESARRWPRGWRLAVVGADWGDWERCSALAISYNVDVAAHVGFLQLEEFAAAIAAADLVVVPTDVASQSGVLALARELGTRSVAARVGGLSELATKTFEPGDVDDLTQAIDEELREPSQEKKHSSETDAIRIHLRAYGFSDAEPLTPDFADDVES